MTPPLPDVAFRITRKDYAASAAEALSGVGGLYDSGRWHSRGKRIVYSAQSSSLCILERVVHADEWMADRRDDRVVLKLTVPRVSWTGYLAAELARRDPNWRVEGNVLCRRLGDMWLQGEDTCALVVPSAANPIDYNLLFNPDHREFPLLLSANASLDTELVDVDERVVSLVRARRGGTI